MIYLADQWPEQYRGRLFTINMHGRRLNDERLEREGSGYVARHDPDMIFAADPFFRGLELSYGPDGSAYIIDWSDAGECHESTGVHRTSGRVYRVTYGDPAPQKPIDLGKLGVDELVALHKHSNEWYARQARRQLVARAERGEHSRVAADQLTAMTREADSTAIRLRALGSLFAIGQADDQLLHALLADRDEHLRTWAIRLLTDRWPLDTVMGPEAHVPPASVTTAQLAELVALAKSDDSGLVRLVLASVLQRLAVTQRPALATALASRDEDADDHNLPAMVWYGLIPVGDVDPQRLPQVAAATRWPKLRQWIARRLAEDLAKNAAPLDALLATAASKPDGGLLADALAGMSAGLAGWHKAPRPASWDKVQTAAEAGSASERELVRDLSVLFGDGRALGEVRKIALDGSADMNLRRAALETLIQSRPDDLRSICEALLGTRFLNTIAVRGLAAFDDPKLGAKLAKNYKKFHHSERAAIMETLVSRPTFALAMLDEMAAGNIARSDLSVFQARQIRSFKDPKLAKRLADVWGEIRDSSADKTQAIAQLKEQLTPTVLGESDAGQGRVVFNTACATCHRLYGHGGEIGPDLTGAARQNIDYLLSNIVDPSAVVTADFRMSVVQLADGRVLNGIVRSQNQRTVTLQTAKERLAIDRGDIDAIEPSPLSLMPEGLLQPLKPDQVRNLFAYLMTFSQVPLPPGAPPTDVTSGGH
jgi:putative heme-binding domain-containing protein